MSKFTEALHSDWTQEFSISEQLFQTTLAEQELTFFNNQRWGRVFTINGTIQTTERDEFVYHEMMAHVPLFAHPNPIAVAVIGGGDGGIIREVAKHQSISRIEMCELDSTILDLCNEYLPNHNAGSFSDKRLRVNINDGCKWLSQQPDNSFDVIISDCTDPIGPGENLFTSDFYYHASRCLRDHGVFVAQNGVCFLQEDEITTTHRRLQPYFDKVGFYFATVPTYIGGQLAFAYGTKGNIDIRSPQITGEWVKNLQYYNKEIHTAAFAVPNNIVKILKINK
ncbi:SpeE Spermidine synthase [uncultured Caudovirales phage]|uniref:SpeE Spermidine synthase n=1 Tax=uncultured Caudovirales phage TaxID=2100421 RepID=A0A6J5L6F9_9CAUD|nr:SpeE Spermidine synthase [uncultured Caudovirales phage]